MVKEIVKSMNLSLIKKRTKEYNDYSNNTYNEYNFINNVYFLSVPIYHKYIKEVHHFKDTLKKEHCSYYYHTHTRVLGIPIRQYKFTNNIKGDCNNPSSIGFIVK
jgi:hypothetical protein